MMSDGPLRVLIADDEPIARRRLARLLDGLGYIKLLGQAGDCDQTIAAVRQLRPELLLLDVQMPGGDGFSVIDRLGAEMPLVIFVTAFDHYSLRAFETAAVDYVTKPVELPRLAAAIARARQALSARNQAERVTQLQAMVASLRASLGEMRTTDQDIWVKVRDGHVRLAIGSIDYVRAERDYVRICAGERSFLIAETMTAMNQRLAPLGFLRIHRGILVRKSAIQRVLRRRYGALAVQMADGRELGIGRSHAPDVLKALQLQPSASAGR